MKANQSRRINIAPHAFAVAGYHYSEVFVYKDTFAVTAFMQIAVQYWVQNFNCLPLCCYVIGSM